MLQIFSINRVDTKTGNERDRGVSVNGHLVRSRKDKVKPMVRSNHINWSCLVTSLIGGILAVVVM
jgi:hypothetical protein